MAFHTKDDPGKSINIQDAESLIAANFIPVQIGDSQLYWGFFPKELLATILDEPSCVGIRLYNAFHPNMEKERLIVVGVTEDGSEIQSTSTGESGYSLISFKSTFNNESLIGGFDLSKKSRVDAAHLVRSSWGTLTQGGLHDPDISFASFFSADAVRKLLAPEACNGISFYVVGLRKPAVFPFSHLAVSAQHLLATNRIELLGEEAQCIICPDPCPPRCAPEVSNMEAATGSASEAFDVAASLRKIRPVTNLEISENSFDKYLERWM